MDQEIVTGMPAAVGYTASGRRRGWSSKDTQFASALDHGEQTRDILSAITGTNVVSFLSSVRLIFLPSSKVPTNPSMLDASKVSCNRYHIPTHIVEAWRR